MSFSPFMRLANKRITTSSLNPKTTTFSTRTTAKRFNSSHNQPKSSFSSKLGILIGLAGLPVASFFIYDRFAALPNELNDKKFPLLARFYIRRALCPVNSIEETARCLDLAMQRVLASGLGSASPESTALVLFLARLYLEASESNNNNSSIPDLEAAFHALTFKPHVGEAIKEELARLELSFKVAQRLCSFYSSKSHCNPEKVHFYAGRSLEFMDSGPSYLKTKFSDHELRKEFQKYKKLNLQ
jgi:hypothetical protein